MRSAVRACLSAPMSSQTSLVCGDFVFYKKIPAVRALLLLLSPKSQISGTPFCRLVKPLFGYQAISFLPIFIKTCNLVFIWCLLLQKITCIYSKSPKHYSHKTYICRKAVHLLIEKSVQPFFMPFFYWN